MKIKNKKKLIKKRLFILVASVVAISIVVLSSLALTSFFGEGGNQPPLEQPSPTQPTPAPGEDIPPTIDADKQDLGEKPNPGEQQDTSVTITSTSVVNGALRVRSLIQGVFNEGTCTLSVKRGETVVISREAPVQAGPSSSTCRGFDIAIDSLEDGVLSVNVSFDNGSISSISETKEITLTR